jgi:hypothetical protein
MWLLGFYDGHEPFDAGIEQFSSDGNEMTNDNAYPPAESNIWCGVWEQVGNRKYKMKHIDWVWDWSAPDLTSTPRAAGCFHSCL